MDTTRLRPGEILCGVAALMLLIDLFAKWNFADGDDEDGQSIRAFENESGFDALGPFVLLLVLIAIGLAFALVVTTATKKPAAIPIGAAVLTAGVGLLVLLVLVVRVLFLDDSQMGAYFGLVFMVGITVGGWLSMGDERTEAPYSAPPDLEPRPVPPAEG